MNYKSILKISCLMLCVCVLTSACKNKKSTDQEGDSKPLVSGISLDNLDKSAAPKQDFYQYACGGWIKNHPRPASYSRYGSFDQLGESTEKQLHKLLSDVAEANNAEGSNAKKIADLYNCGMDEKTIEQQGALPITPILKQISAIQDKKELTNLLADLHGKGYDAFYSLMAMASPENSSINIAWLMQSGLGLGEREYYLEATPAIKNGYVKMMEDLFSYTDYSTLSNQKNSELVAKVWAFETELAKINIDKNIFRDPVKTNNVLTLAQTSKLMTIIDLSTYATQRVPNKVEEVNVVLSSYFQNLDNLLKKTDLNTIKAYLAWNVICDAAPYLSNNFVNASFDFYGKTLQGKGENKERWQRVVSTVSGLLGEPVGQLYVKQYFPAAAKERMIQMVKNLKEALGERIQKTEWMTDETKTKALDKLQGIIVKVGYPDKWRDYSNLTIEKDSYYTNVLRIRKFENDFQLSKVGKPVDPTLWQMSPQTVNAYYEPTTNEICFPAAILQPPFFDMNADDAANYGAIGVVIGHEMTHGFDDQGRHYDKVGNVCDWWSEADSKNFSARAQVLVDHFNAIEVLPGLFANGQYTLGENIADNGGVNTSFDALQKAKKQNTIREEMDGFTADQRFFLAYAAVWANTITDQEIERRTKVDVHSLGKWRVNGTLPHVDGFIKTFDIKPGDKMYLAPEKRAKIW